MKKLLTVREFDIITCNPDFREEYPFLPEADFRKLEEFVRNSGGNQDSPGTPEFLKIGFRRNLGPVITVTNFAGVIAIPGGYQIEVLPKMDFPAESDSDAAADSETSCRETRRILLRMLQSLGDFPGHFLREAGLGTDRMPLFEIFIGMYLGAVRDLVKHGLKSAYAEREGNLSFLRGKIIFGEHLRRNAAHGERFYVRYEEYISDRAENRLLRAALERLRAVAGSLENQREASRLLGAFEMIPASRNFAKDFSEAKTERHDRSSGEYRDLMRWTEVFLGQRSFAPFSGGDRALAFLFPVERLFEAFIARELRKELQDSGWDFSVQDRSFYLFDSPSRFALRPDMVITRNDGTRVILDTKWKSLVNDPGRNYGISQSDMYQMYVYAKKYDTPEVWLVYPLNREMRGIRSTRGLQKMTDGKIRVMKGSEEPGESSGPGIISFESGDGVRAGVFFADMARIGESMQELRELLVKRGRT